MRLTLLLLCALVCCCAQGYSQTLLSQALQATGLQKEAADGIHSVSDKSVHFLQKKYDKINASVQKQSQQMLARMQRKEEKLERKLKRKDSTKAAELFAGVQGKYQSLITGIADPVTTIKNKAGSLPGRLSRVDSLKNVLHRREQQANTLLSEAERNEISRADSILQTVQDKLSSRMNGRDSSKAAALLTDIESKYRHLGEKLPASLTAKESFPLKEYIPGIDSMQTALRFLQSKNIGLPQEKLQQITKASSELEAVQSKLQKATEMESFIKERERALKEQLQHSGVGRQLKSINKEAFYYSQRLREYKELLTNKEKAEQKLLGAVRESHLFKSFMQKHSYLAKLFPAPQNYGTPAALAGLQTRAGVQQALQQRFGTSPPASRVIGTGFSTGGEGAAGASNGGGMGGATGYLQQQMSAAQAQFGKLKDKMSKLGMSGGSSDMTMPDFKPNSQHTKSFLQRIEYGLNVQSEGARSVIPATSEGALTLGYKVNDKSTIGIGASYRVGWGHEGLKHITVTNEGVGLRSYVDIKAKGNIWISGGYEMNYMQAFAKYQQLYDIHLWQRSGLIGLTKKYKVGKKENTMQVLWDFLSYSQVPRTQAIKFRVGVGL